MRKSLLSLVALAPLAFAQTQTFTYSYGGLSIPIYPDDWDTVGIATIFVPRSISITKVTASVQVQFSGVGDLNVFMWSPAGTRTKLLERNCGSLVNIDTTFDDSAGTRFSDACPTAVGNTFRGNEPLSNWNNQNAFGYWRLAVENNGSSRTGFMTAFSVTITGTSLGPPAITPGTVVSTSSFMNGSVAPGDQVSIVGANLGPSAGVRADATTNLPTSLGSTTVTFDGAAAPLFYVSDKFIAAQAPTTLTPGATTRIQVTSSSGSSGVVNLSVVPAKPGIFTRESAGKGQAKAINQDGTINGDGSINTADRGAPTGSVLQIFASGLGALSPAISSGTPAPSSPLSTATLPVTATIGGRPAMVMYAGAAPGLIGVYQVNLMVPSNAPTGAAKLVITAEGNSSQDGVTVQIR